MKKFFLSAFLAVALCGLAQAAQKIATVDVAVVMTKYQKAVDLRARLENDAKQAKASQDDKVQKLQAMRTEAEQLIKSTKDPILNEQGRKDAEAKAQAKIQEFQQADREAFQQAQTVASALQSREQANLKTIADEVKPVVAKIAKEKGIDIVAPVATLLYSEPSLDITEEIVKQLNAGYTPSAQ